MKLINLYNLLTYWIYRKSKKYIKFYENFSYDIKKNGEKYIQKKLSKFNIKVIFDIGSHTGGWTQMCSDIHNQSKFHLFEISTSSFQKLSQTFKKKENITCNNFGLSDKDTNIDYVDYGEYSQINSLILKSNFHNNNLSNIKKTYTTTGDSYCKKNKIYEIDFLKIDVEGAENLVLKGFNEMLNEAKIKIIQFEYGHINADTKFLINDFYEFLQSKGYILGPLKKNGAIFMEFCYSLNNFDSGPNFIAVHKSQKEIIKAINGKKINGYPYL